MNRCSYKKSMVMGRSTTEEQTTRGYFGALEARDWLDIIAAMVVYMGKAIKQ